MVSADVYLITEREPALAFIDENGALRLRLDGDVASLDPPPAWYSEIVRVRRDIGDPAHGDFVYGARLPLGRAPPEVAFTEGDGVYWRYADGAWERLSLKVSDAAIRALIADCGRRKASIRLLDDFIARLDPADYLTSGNAGGQSMSFPTFAEALGFYETLKRNFIERDAEVQKLNSGVMARTRKRFVGGVIE